MENLIKSAQITVLFITLASCTSEAPFIEVDPSPLSYEAYESQRDLIVDKIKLKRRVLFHELKDTRESLDQEISESTAKLDKELKFKRLEKLNEHRDMIKAFNGDEIAKMKLAKKLEQERASLREEHADLMKNLKSKLDLRKDRLLKEASKKMMAFNKDSKNYVNGYDKKFRSSFAAQDLAKNLKSKKSFN